MVTLLKTIGVKDVQLSNLIIQGSASKDLKISMNEQIALKEKINDLYKNILSLDIFIILKCQIVMVQGKYIHLVKERKLYW